MIDVDDTTYLLMHGEMDSTDDIMEAVEQEQEHRFHNYRVLIHEIESLRAEVKRLQSEPTVTVDDYDLLPNFQHHTEVYGTMMNKGELYVTVHFPDGEQYVGLVEKWEGEEE